MAGSGAPSARLLLALCLAAWACSASCDEAAASASASAAAAADPTAMPPSRCSPVACLLDPCDPSINPCAANGTACVASYCGGCTASCKGPATPEPVKCYSGEPYMCFASPCFVRKEKCPASRVCVDEYCGGCLSACLPKARCANGKPRRACIGGANGCMLAKCGFGAACVPDQCNDCGARCIGPCKAGQYINTDSAACEPCPLGHACPYGTPMPEPVPCNSGTHAPRRGLAACVRCRRGTSTPNKPGRAYSKCTRR